MDVSLFDFELPEDRIALRPAVPRDSARLLVVQSDGTLEHRQISELPKLLRPGDVLVANDTKVIPARLYGWRENRINAAGKKAAIEVLLHKRISPQRFLAFARPARKLAPQDSILFDKGVSARVLTRNAGGEIEIGFDLASDLVDAAIMEVGKIPLPPYIARKREVDAQDASDYQTVFATATGSVAAPTAGLHFTSSLLSQIEAASISRETITLHVGAGTFLPISGTDTSQHRMHSEWTSISDLTERRIGAARKTGGRIVAIGTTSLRALETAARPDGHISEFTGETDIFIAPGYPFKTANILLTNFHLPRSTLFMLVCAFMGTEVMQNAYAEAIREKYRFYSYGDACLLFR